jgi:TIR domain-containing protein
MDVQIVFLSYSNQDRALADKVRQVLEKQQRIRVLFAPEDVPIGSPSWEDVIRDRIRAAVDGVVLIATPNSRNSPYVCDELRLALQLRYAIYPLWAGGNTFRDAIPHDLKNYQGCDIQGEKFDPGMRKFLMDFEHRVSWEERIVAYDIEADRKRQQEEKKAIFDTFRDRVKPVLLNWENMKNGGASEIVNACTDYLDAMSRLKRRYGDRWLPDHDSLSNKISDIIVDVQKAQSKGKAGWFMVIPTIVKHAAELITRYEKSWGKIGGETVEGSVAPEVPGSDES